MGDEHGVELQHMVARERLGGRLVHARVDQQRLRSVAHEDRVRLPDIEHGDRRRGEHLPVRKPAAA